MSKPIAIRHAPEGCYARRSGTEVTVYLIKHGRVLKLSRDDRGSGWVKAGYQRCAQVEIPPGWKATWCQPDDADAELRKAITELSRAVEAIAADVATNTAS